jgi:hypothetical protein
MNTDYFDKSKSRISAQQKKSVFIRSVCVIRVPVFKVSCTGQTAVRVFNR